MTSILRYLMICAQPSIRQPPLQHTPTHRQDAYLRRYLQCYQDLPGQGMSRALMITCTPHLTSVDIVLLMLATDLNVLTLRLQIQGKLYVRGDSKIFRFQNGKTESLFLQRKNPRRIAWTMLYRRMHKKGISEVRNYGHQEPTPLPPVPHTSAYVIYHI